MRGLAALTLFVSLYCGELRAGTSDAPDNWTDLHGKAVDAVSRKELQTALPLLTKCTELAQTPLETAVSASDLGITLVQLGRTKQAQYWLGHALEVWKTGHEPFGRFAQTWVSLAAVDRALGDYSGAEQLLRDALARAPEEQALTASGREAKALALDELGDMLREEGRSGESRELLSQSARIPGVSWRRGAEATAGLAELDRDAHNWETGLAEWNHVADLARAHADIALEAVASRGLGQLWLDRGDAARAEPLLRKSLAAFESDSGSAGQIAPTLTCLAALYMGEDKLAMAEEVLNRALRSDESELGESNPQVAIVLEMLGDLLARRNRMEVARQDLDRLTRIISDTFGERSCLNAAALASWGVIEQRAGYPAKAAALFEKVLAVLPSGAGADLATLKVMVLRHYAEALKATHRKQEANAVLAEVKSFHER